MKLGRDIAVEFGGLTLIHQNLPGKKVESFVSDHHIVFMPQQGEIAVQLDERDLTLGPGSMLYLPCDARHSFRSSKTQGERLIALISKKAWNQHAKITAGKTQFPPSIVPSSQLIKEVLFYLLLHPKTKSSPTLLAVLVETLSENLEGQEGLAEGSLEHLSGKVADPRLAKALRYMEENFSEDIHVDTIAKNVGLSLRTFNRLMLKETGLSPRQWLIRVRIRKAQTLLASGSISTTEAAYAVGYQSLSQFIAAFRKTTGQLPSEFQRFGTKPKL